MQHYVDSVTAFNGDKVTNAIVTVTTLAGNTAPIYLDVYGTMPVTSVSTNTNGEFDFYIQSGRYNINVSGPGITAYSLLDVFIFYPNVIGLLSVDIGGTGVNTSTGTGSVVLNISPTLVTPVLGTPASGNLSNCTNITATTNANLTGAITSVGNASSLGSFTSANLSTALTDETGTGANVFATSPTLVTPILGTPTSGVATNLTGLPLTTGVTGILAVANGGTGVATLDSASVLIGAGTGNVTSIAPGTLGNVLTSNGSAWTSSAAASSVGFKNRIINGAMVIDQRNAGASGTAGAYTVDRWAYQASQSSKLTWQQNAGSVTPPIGFTNYLGYTTTTAFSIGAGDFFWNYQVIEGYNIADLAWGTANAKTVTLSFQVYSSLTGTFGGALQNNAQNRSYPFTYSITVANTWTTISITIAGDTAGTWTTTNTAGLRVYFGLGVGTNYLGTAGAWAGAGYYSATGAVSVVGTSGATFYITGVQLEKGSVATSFDYRPYGTELSLCQRYLPCWNAIASATVGVGIANSTINLYTVMSLPVQTRVSPTGITVSNGTYFTAYNSGAYASSAVTFGGASNQTAYINLTVAGAVLGQAFMVQSNNAAGQIQFTGCEL